MSYSADRKPLELTALTSLASDDTFVVGDTSDTSEVAKSITKANLLTDLQDETQTLSNKTIALGSNTVSGTLAQFNTAITDANIIPEAGGTFTGDISVPDEVYGAGWNGSVEVPTKNALYDKIETLGGGSGITRTVVVTSGSATMGSTASTDYTYLVAGAHTMSLPAASGNTNRYTVKNNHSANITVDTLGAETVEGAASISVAPEESVDIISDGTNFRII